MLKMGHLGRTGEKRNTGKMLASKTEGRGVVRGLCIDGIISRRQYLLYIVTYCEDFTATFFHSNTHECNFIDTQKKITAIPGSISMKLSNVQQHYL